MYCTFARFEEVKQLKVEQLLLSEGDVVVTFRKGKTYQMGEARKAVIPGGVYEGFNSTKVLKAYLDKLKNIEGNEADESYFWFYCQTLCHFEYSSFEKSCDGCFISYIFFYD